MRTDFLCLRQYESWYRNVSSTYADIF